MTVDANDIPPGSRLFLVVPREADAQLLQAELFRFDGCEHVKVDAVAAKGICFAKYETASAAHIVMETIHRADCKLGPYKVKVFPAEPKDSSARNAGHAALSPPPQLHLPDNLYDYGGMNPAGMSSGLGSELFAMLGGEGPPFMGGPHAVPSTGNTMLPHSGASAGPAAPQSGGHVWSPPHSLNPVSGSSIGPGAGGSIHEANMPNVHVSHQLLQQEQQSRKVAAAQGQAPIFDSSTAGQQLAQLFAKLQTNGSEPPPANGPRMSSVPNIQANQVHRMMPPGAQMGDSNARQMWQDTSPRMHLNNTVGHQNPYAGVGILGDLGSSSTTGPGIGSNGVVASPGGSYNGHNAGGGYPHGVTPYHERFSHNMNFPGEGVVSSNSTPENMMGYNGWANPPGSGSRNSPAQSIGPGAGGLGQAPEVSMQRLFVVVSKSATEEQIAKQFKRFGGMEYCNLKRDKKTGQSKGYCFVNYSTAESAAAAMKALNGIEFPTGSGRNMKVIYSEVLQSNRQPGANRGAGPQMHGAPASAGAPVPGPLLPQGHDFDIGAPGTYPRIPSGTGGLYHHSHDALSLPQSRHSGPPSQEAPSIGGSMGVPGQIPQPLSGSHAALFEGNFADFVAAHNVDQSRGLLSVPSAPVPAPPPRSNPLSNRVPVQGRPQHSLSPPPRPPQPRDQQLQHPTAPPQQGAAPSAGLCDPAVLLVHITRPLPEYALQHEFSKYGTVTSAKLLEEDGCYAMVHMEDPTAAANAATALNKSQLCGMTLTVESSTVSVQSSQYPSSRGPSSHGLSSTGSMQTTVPFAAMMPTSGVPHYLDRNKHQRSSGDLSGQFVGTNYVTPPHASASMHGNFAQGSGMPSPTMGNKAPTWWMSQG